MLRISRCFLLALAVMSGPAAAQDWTTRLFFSDGWFFGSVVSPDQLMIVACSGSYPGADPMLGAEDGPHPVYGVTLELAQPEIEARDEHWSNGATRNDVMIVSNELGFMLPDLGFNALNGERWESQISVGDALITSLLAGGGASVFVAQTHAASYPAGGLASGLTEVLQFCDSHWAANAQPLPSHAAQVIQAIRGQAPAPLGGHGAALDMEAEMLADITQTCNGPGQVRADVIGRSDFDGDGIEDIVLDWSGVSCNSGSLAGQRGAGNCGFHNCLISAYVSSVAQSGGEQWALLAMGGWVDPGVPNEIVTGTAPHLCPQLGLPPGCLLRWQWMGTEFVQQR